LKKTYDQGTGGKKDTEKVPWNGHLGNLKSKKKKKLQLSFHPQMIKVDRPNNQGHAL